METPTKKLLLYSFYAFGAFCLVPIKQRGLLFVLLSLATLTIIVNKRKVIITKEALINMSTYILFVLSLFYVTDFSRAFSKLETTFSLLLGAILFSNIWNGHLSFFNKEKWMVFAKYFYASTVFFSIIIFPFFIWPEFFYENPIDITFLYGYRSIYLLIFDHPIYVSLYVSLAILFSFELIKQHSFKTKLVYILIDILLFLFILILAKRGVIIGFITSCFVYFLFKFTKARNKLYTFFSFVLLLWIVIFVFPNTKHRFFETIDPDTYKEVVEHNSTSHRFHIYKCSLEVFKKSSLIGHGIGDDKKELVDCYKDYPKEFSSKDYNTHNQYLGVLLKTGIIGFLFFLFFLFYNYKIAIQRNDTLYLSFLVLFSIIMLFENVLERQNGVMLFAFFINYFAHKNKL